MPCMNCDAQNGIGDIWRPSFLQRHPKPGWYYGTDYVKWPGWYRGRGGADTYSLRDYVGWLRTVSGPSVRPFIGFINGTFDILHPGHHALIEMAAHNCVHLIVGVNSDESVKFNRGRSPVFSDAARASMLLMHRQVCHVVIFNEKTACEVMQEIKPDIYFKGADYEGRDFPEKAICPNIKYQPRNHWSSTFIKDKLKAGYG